MCRCSRSQGEYGTRADLRRLYIEMKPGREEGEREKRVRMLPYFLRMSRGRNGAMRVWLKEPVGPETVTNGSR